MEYHGEMGTCSWGERNATDMARSAYGIVEADGWLDVQRQSGVGRIVAIASVVDKT